MVVGGCKKSSFTADTKRVDESQNQGFDSDTDIADLAAFFANIK